MTSPTPRRTTCDTPPPPHRAPRKQSLRGWILGRWGIKPPFAEASGDEPPRPAGTPPLDEELVTFPLRAEFPSIGGVARSAGVVRECRIGYLLSCHSRARGPRKYECICGVDKAGIGSIKFISRITDK